MPCFRQFALITNHRTFLNGCVEIATMKHSVWEFLRKPDGSYAVTHNGELLADSIPEKWFATQICKEYGFCGQESVYICTELDRSGICTVDLSASDNPFRVSHDE
jgi:hypothetical protein